MVYLETSMLARFRRNPVMLRWGVEVHGDVLLVSSRNRRSGCRRLTMEDKPGILPPLPVVEFFVTRFAYALRALAVHFLMRQNHCDIEEASRTVGAAPVGPFLMVQDVEMDPLTQAPAGRSRSLSCVLWDVQPAGGHRRNAEMIAQEGSEERREIMFRTFEWILEGGSRIEQGERCLEEGGEECAVCLEGKVQARLLPCCEQFVCQTCMKAWKKATTRRRVPYSCPLCRRDLRTL
jgi:hypothetical protein